MPRVFDRAIGVSLRPSTIACGRDWPNSAHSHPTSRSLVWELARSAVRSYLLSYCCSIPLLVPLGGCFRLPARSSPARFPNVLLEWAWFFSFSYNRQRAAASAFDTSSISKQWRRKKIGKEDTRPMHQSYGCVRRSKRYQQAEVWSKNSIPEDEA